ncbi:1-deoxy-D-xylulose-5-phosphate synthase [Streptomyces alboniger]
MIGDGALTGGMAWEALNNIAAAKDRPLIVVVNDNERSYAPTIGGLANHLATLRTTDGYERLGLARTCSSARRWSATPSTRPSPCAKKGFKDAFAPQGLFEDLDSSTSARSTGTTSVPSSRRCAEPSASTVRCWCTASPKRERRVRARPARRGGPLPPSARWTRSPASR